MMSGTLGKYFSGVVMKSLSIVEIDAKMSNQHEFNGTVLLRKLFGEDDRLKIKAVFIWLDDEEDYQSQDGFISWYDARRAHLTRTEYRLYYPSNAVTKRAREGDVLFIATQPDGSALVILTPPNCTVQSQLVWLFDLPIQTELGFTLADTDKTASREIGYVEDIILAQLGLEPPPPADMYQDLVAQFGLVFPPTRILSDLARQISDASALDDPDGALLTYMQEEQTLFRALEKNIVKLRISEGFGEDVDGFINYSLSVQNRRKSRAGHALGNHVEAILLANSITHKREATTEKQKGPDFLFPSEAAYHDAGFASDRLRMLAVKTTCKDRWRQVMAEADRIAPKHLLTLQLGISSAQTTEMSGAKVQLVVPQGLLSNYTMIQQVGLINFAQFIDLVR